MRLVYVDTDSLNDDVHLHPSSAAWKDSSNDRSRLLHFVLNEVKPSFSWTSSLSPESYVSEKIFKVKLKSVLSRVTQVLTHSAEERLVSVQILTLLIDRVNTTGILVVRDDVFRRLRQQTVLVLAVNQQSNKSNQIKSNIFDNTKKQNKQTDENEKITTKCMQKNSKTTC